MSHKNCSTHVRASSSSAIQKTSKHCLIWLKLCFGTTRESIRVLDVQCFKDVAKVLCDFKHLGTHSSNVNRPATDPAMGRFISIVNGVLLAGVKDGFKQGVPNSLVQQYLRSPHRHPTRMQMDLKPNVGSMERALQHLNLSQLKIEKQKLEKQTPNEGFGDLREQLERSLQTVVTEIQLRTSDGQSLDHTGKTPANAKHLAEQQLQRAQETRSGCPPTGYGSRSPGGRRDSQIRPRLVSQV